MLHKARDGHTQWTRAAARAVKHANEAQAALLNAEAALNTAEEGQKTVHEQIVLNNKHKAEAAKKAAERLQQKCDGWKGCGSWGDCGQEDAAALANDTALPPRVDPLLQLHAAHNLLGILSMPGVGRAASDEGLEDVIKTVEQSNLAPAAATVQRTEHAVQELHIAQSVLEDPWWFEAIQAVDSAGSADELLDKVRNQLLFCLVLTRCFRLVKSCFKARLRFEGN